MKNIGLSVSVLAVALLVAGEQATAGRGLFSHGSYGSSGGSVGSAGSHGSAGSYGSSGGSGGSYGSHGSDGGSSGSYGSADSYGSSGGSSTGSLGGLFRRHRSASSASLGSTGSSGGSYGSTGSHGGSSGGSSGGLTPRQIRLERRAARRAASHGSSGGASYGSASSGGSVGGSHGGSYGVTVPYAAPYGGGSYGYHSATRTASPYAVAARRPVAPAVARVAPVVASAPAVDQPDFAYVVVTLPQDAVLYLGGNRTNASGTVRQFKIPMPTADESLPYAVRVVLNRDGKEYVAQSTESLLAGKTVSVKVNDVQTDVDVAAL